MTKVNVPEINIDELMEKIRAEVNRRRHEKEKPGQSSPGAELVSEKVPRPKISHLNLEFFGNPQPLDLKAKSYHINSFLKYYDDDFLNNGYWAILGREPDSEGLRYFLEKLRQGAMTNIEVLGRLRYSAEGRNKRVRVQGLLFPFLVHSSFRIPVLGYFARLTTGILQLPTFIRNFQNLDSHFHAQLQHLKDHLNQTIDSVQKKVNRTIDVHSYFLQNLSDEKADRYALEDLIVQKADRKELEFLVAKKVDTHVLDELLAKKADREEMETSLSRKADREEMEASLSRRADAAVVKELEERKVDRDALDRLLFLKADREEMETFFSRKVDSAVVEEMEKNKASRIELRRLGDEKAGKSELEGILEQIKDLKRNILDQNRRLRLLLEEARKRLPDPISTPQTKTIVSEEAHLLDAMYASFEDRFRGTREDIKNRQAIYLPYLKEADVGTSENPLIDVGCGRGEWLELLKENGFVAKGIDINRVLVLECRERGLEVTIGDAVEVLRKEKPHSHGAITAFHLVEHLPIRVLVVFFDEVFRVLKSKGLMIFETPNPDNILVGSRNFYIDPTHRNPIPSPTLQSIAEARGFENVQILNLHPVPDYDRDEAVDEPLNRLLYGPQDYALIGYKL